MNNTVITAEEKALIQQLKDRTNQEQLLPGLDSDYHYNKWLKARNNDLDKAEEMLQRHIKTIRNFGINEVQSEKFDPNPAAFYFHTARLGYDSEGSVVRIIHIGASDLRGISSSISKRDAFRFAAHIIFQDIKQQKIDREGKTICDKQVYVFDLEGLNWSSVIHRTVAQLAFTLLKNYESNFPENLKVVYVVHAPSFFSFIYGWIKTVLPESILTKVEIVPDDKIHSVVTKNIDPSILPVSVGGTMKDPDGDPNCPSIYKMPLKSTVPESLMLCQQLNILENDPTAKRIVVDCGCASRVQLKVEVAESTIQWDFQTSGYDICFGLNYKESESSPPSQIITPHRVDCHRFPESGSFKCIETGIYELIFDNTYSWLTKKELIYKVKVLHPDEVTEI